MTEAEFEKQEKQRRDLEKKKEYLMEGRSTEGAVSLENLDSLKRVFADSLTGEAYRQLSSLIDLSRIAVTLKEDLGLLRIAAGKLGDVPQLSEDLNRLDKSVAVLIEQNQNVISKIMQVLDEEELVLAKLNKYLDNWL